MAGPEVQFTDGTESVFLDGTFGWLNVEGWKPQAPHPRSRAVNVSGVDGGEIDGTDYENVAETLTCKLIGGTATVRSTIQRLLRLFNYARMYREPAIPIVLCKFRPDSAEGWYYSQVLVGTIIYDKDALDWQWWNGQIDVTLIFTRRFFWEADTETEVPLIASGAGSSGATGGITLTNQDTASGHNFVDIPIAAIGGDTPSACRLLMTNGSSVTITKVYVSLEPQLTWSIITALYEGESATPLSNQASALSSGGNFNRLTWSGATETDIATWTITGAQLAAAGGRWMRALARFANTFAYTDLYLRLRLTANGVTLWNGEQQLMTASVQLQEIGSLPLPPRLGGLSSLANISMVLSAQRIAGGSLTADLDHLTLLSLNGWRKFTAIANGMTSGQTLNDDGIAGRVYTTQAGGNYSDWAVEGNPLRLWPDPARTQRLRFAWARSDSTMVIADQMAVRLYYRLRRLTL